MHRAGHSADRMLHAVSDSRVRTARRISMLKCRQPVSYVPVFLMAGSAYLLALLQWLAPPLQPARLQAHA